LPSNCISLHDQSGQKKDIADFVRAIVYSDQNMGRWRDEDKQLVIETLSEMADGMYVNRSVPVIALMFPTGFVGSIANLRSYVNASRRAYGAFIWKTPTC